MNHLQLLINELQDSVKMREMELINGQCRDYSDYCRLTGYIRGVHEALQMAVARHKLEAQDEAQ